MEQPNNKSDTNQQSGKSGDIWRTTDFECPECGNTALTNSKAEEGYFYDGDELYCPVCHTEGQVMCDEGDAWDHWNW